MTTNVVLVIMDDMRTDLMPYMPFVNGVMRPAGTELTNMRCEVPLCSPARAAILTGRHGRDPENLTYTQNDGLGDPNSTIPVWISAATASNGMFGKYMVFGSGTKQPGWDRWCVINSNTQEPYAYTCKDENGVQYGPGTSTGVHQVNYFQSQINPYLASVAEPFFCYLAPTNPHVNGTEFRNNPLPASCTKFSWVNWPLTHLLSSADAATKPSFRDMTHQLTEDNLAYMRGEIRQQIRECYDIDVVIKSMWDTLVARGGSVFSNTVWIFATDSGVFFEEQRIMAAQALISLSSKNDIYDCVSKVPAFILGTGIPAGRKESTPMTLQDITATILALFGSSATVTLRGTDIRTIIASPPADRDTLYERKNEPGQPDAVGIVTKTRKLIKYVGQTAPDTYEMYDLDTDPWENTNVANNPVRLAERNALEVRLNAIP